MTTNKKHPNNLPSRKPRPRPPHGPINAPECGHCAGLTETLRSVINVLQCVVCHRSLGPLRLCVNAHPLCSGCMQRCGRYCPVCKSAVLENRPALVAELLRLLPRPCGFAEAGCDQLVLASDRGHETFCRHRRTHCRLKDCEWCGPAKGLLSHLEAAHGGDMIRSETVTSVMGSFNSRLVIQAVNVIVVHNNIFWQHMRIGNGQVVQCYQYVPLGAPTRSFKAYVSFDTAETSYNGTTPVHTDVYDPNQLLRADEAFRLPRRVAATLDRSRKGTITYSFTISPAN